MLFSKQPPAPPAMPSAPMMPKAAQPAAQPAPAASPAAAQTPSVAQSSAPTPAMAQPSAPSAPTAPKAPAPQVNIPQVNIPAPQQAQPAAPAPAPAQMAKPAAQPISKKPTPVLYGSKSKQGIDEIRIDASGKEYVYTQSLTTLNFADLWFSPERIAYIRDKRTKFALIPLISPDLEAFYRVLEQGFTGSTSYAASFKEQSYRIERITTTTGIQYNCRKMPTETPDINTLGLPSHIVKELTGLAEASGLILFAGPTGMGKTTTMSALVSHYLQTHGGFLYTIEDPPEMPLDGLYYAQNGGLGLCKQTPVEFERWEDGLKSALRSRPRYILIGEIRTPEVASQALRAATSGHLVVSSIHANSVEDALNSIIKYASSAGLDESLASDLLARGILSVVHQVLDGVEELHPVLHTVFANPDPLASDQLRMAIRENKLSLGTLMETQEIRLKQGKSMFNKYA